MNARGACRPVAGSRCLEQQRPPSNGAYLAGPVRGATIAQPIALPNLRGASDREVRSLVNSLYFETTPDWSGSTFSVWGGDPNDVIGAVVLSVFMWLRRHGGGMAGVLPWGTTPATDLAVGPTPVRKEFKQLKAAIRNRVNLGGNDLPAALRVTAERISKLPAGVVPFVWVPTDGIEPVTNATHDAVNALPSGSAHLVLIDPLRGCTPEMEADWRSVAFGSVTRIEDLSVKHVSTTIAQLCAEALGLDFGPATPSSVAS